MCVVVGCVCCGRVCGGLCVFVVDCVCGGLCVCVCCGRVGVWWIMCVLWCVCCGSVCVCVDYVCVWWSMCVMDCVRVRALKPSNINTEHIQREINKTYMVYTSTEGSSGQPTSRARNQVVECGPSPDTRWNRSVCRCHSDSACRSPRVSVRRAGEPGSCTGTRSLRE